ncbi:hypothetical protein D3C78_1450130 [compost metagenome]
MLVEAQAMVAATFDHPHHADALLDVVQLLAQRQTEAWTRQLHLRRLQGYRVAVDQFGLLGTIAGG